MAATIRDSLSVPSDFVSLKVSDSGENQGNFTTPTEGNFPLEFVGFFTNTWGVLGTHNVVGHIDIKCQCHITLALGKGFVGTLPEMPVG